MLNGIILSPSGRAFAPSSVLPSMLDCGALATAAICGCFAGVNDWVGSVMAKLSTKLGSRANGNRMDLIFCAFIIILYYYIFYLHTGIALQKEEYRH